MCSPNSTTFVHLTFSISIGPSLVTSAVDIRLPICSNDCGPEVLGRRTHAFSHHNNRDCAHGWPTARGQRNASRQPACAAICNQRPVTMTAWADFVRGQTFQRRHRTWCLPVREAGTPSEVCRSSAGYEASSQHEVARFCQGVQ